MRLKSIILENFGPFSRYQLDFPTLEKAHVLLSGKNNAGKSSIIRALKLLSYALKHARNSTQPILGTIAKKDLEDIEIGRLVHNYENDGVAVITGVLENNRQVVINISSRDNTVYFEIPASNASKSLTELIGFIPPLGQIAEREPLVKKESVMNYLNTTYAPRHLRNHVYHLLSEDEQSLVIEIMNQYWKDIKLQRLQLEFNEASYMFYWLYKEGIYSHEISWAGQGLQIWLQIITHMVWLKNKSILLLDEPELFLHPEKQNDLMRVFDEYYDGSVIIATHSSELMNCVDISHIVHVRREMPKNKMIQVSNRAELEKIRNSIGSGFNLVASQFEDVEMLIATENQIDYDIVHQIAEGFEISIKTQNIKVSGFGNRDNAIYYKQAYSLFFGRDVKCSLLLDRDYYPNTYLEYIREELAKNKVNVLYTPGKEIENLFLDENFLVTLTPNAGKNKLHEFLDEMYKNEYDNCFPKYLEFYNKHSLQKEISVSYKDIKPSFDVTWKDKNKRHTLVHGKNTLAKIRDYFKSQYNITLTTNLLVEQIVKTKNNDARSLVSQLFQ